MLDEALKSIASAASLEALDALRVQYLGKSGVITEQLKNLGKLPPEERKEAGQKLNETKNAITAAIDDKKSSLERAALDQKLATEKVDITLPIRPEREGRIHPISQTIEELTSIFGSMGFSHVEGPDIEDDYHNFTALNIPAHHPAREMQDTFFLNRPPTTDHQPLVLRTQTSSVQIRAMEKGKPPFKIISIGRVYRSDWDQTHTPMFHQIEGLYIDKNINMGHLKGCLLEFLSRFFERDSVPLRFRPSYFPFTEPSAEVDIGCKRSKSEITIGEGSDWLEILGCGMVHSNVLKNVGLDPAQWQGFAFGIGIERLAMLKYGIPDLRTFFESDTRWLQHYGFKAV